MKQKLTFFAVLMMAMAAPQGVSAQDTIYNFTAVSPSGHTLYYHVFTDSSNSWVQELGHPHAWVVSPMMEMDDEWNVQEDALWAGFTKPTGNLIIPDSIVYNGLMLPVSVIYNYAFAECSGLLSVTVPNTIELTGGLIFDGCTSLISPVYNSTIFFRLPPSFTGSYSMPDGIMYIYGHAFKDCTGLTSLSLPNTVVSIGVRILENTTLTSITLPNSVDECWYSFTGSSITSPVYNNHLFAYLPPTYSGSYTVPEGITHISEGAIAENPGLISVTLPSSLENLEYNFYDCPNLSDITMQSPVPEGFYDVFFSDHDVMWHVPCRHYSGYYSYAMENNPSATSRIVGFGESNFSDTIAVAICDNDFPYYWGETRYDAAGSYIFDQFAGCDSMTINLQISANPSYMYIVDTFDFCVGVPLEDQFSGDTLAYFENLDQEFEHYGSSVHLYGVGEWINMVDIPYNDMLYTTTLGCDSSYYRRIVYHLNETPQICMVSVNENHNEVIWNKDHMV